MSDLLPLIVYAFMMSVTSEPNNVLATSLAAAHGVRATLPAAAGVSLGFEVIVLVMVAGLAAPLAISPCCMTVCAGRVERGSPTWPGRSPGAAALTRSAAKADQGSNRSARQRAPAWRYTRCTHP